MRIERSPSSTSPATTAPTAASAPSSSSVAPVLLASREKSSDSSTIVATSAIEAAAITSWPKSDFARPASLSTGITTPSEVADRAIATNTGSPTRPAASSPSPTSSAIANESAKPSSAAPQQRPAQPLEVDLQAGEEEQHREAEQREHGHRLVDLDPAEAARTDDDPGDDLEHDGRQPQARCEAEQQRRDERDRRDASRLSNEMSAIRSARDRS